MKILLSGLSKGETFKKILKKESFDKVIIFTSNKYVARAKKLLKKFQGKVYEVDAFDLQSLMQSIGNVIATLKGNIVINITDGTNLMAAAFLCTSYYQGFRTLYVSENNILEMPVPKLKKYFLTKTAKYWLNKINGLMREKRKKGLPEILTAKEISYNTRKLSRPLRLLEKAGLIKTNYHHRFKKIPLEKTDFIESLEYDEKPKKIRVRCIELTPLGVLYGKFINKQAVP